MFVSNKIQKLEHHDWSYCFCADYENRRKCELCITVNDFDYFEELMRGKKLDRDFVSHYHQKLLPYLRQLFFAKKKNQFVFSTMYTRTQFEHFCTMNLEHFMWRILLMNY